jgi:hypothetical protein
MMPAILVLLIYLLFIYYLVPEAAAAYVRHPAAA